MTTTELIEILKDNEYGGISHKPRELSLTINGKYIPNPQITLSSTGDGVCGPEIVLDVDGEVFTEQESKTEWILVSDRLPKTCGMYIVTRKIYDCPDTAPIIMSDESWFDGQDTWHNDNRINHERGYLSDVIAWMPLPGPYKEEKVRYD